MSASRLSFRTKTYLQFVCLFIGAGLLLKACDYLPESTFTLAAGSRPPAWIKLPPELRRADASITMSYYIKSSGRTATFTVKNANGRTIGKFQGSDKCLKPFTLRNPPHGFPEGYPAYEAITVNGITEIVEHRKMEPIFYVTDDAAVRKEYDEVGCR